MKELFSFTPKEIERVESYRVVHEISMLAITFSDIVGYTQICERTPEAVLLRIRSAFDQMSTEQVEKHQGGLIVKRIGDAFLAIYAQPTSAVHAALEIHRILSEGPLEGVSLYLRTGIHVGQIAI